MPGGDEGVHQHPGHSSIAWMLVPPSPGVQGERTPGLEFGADTMSTFFSSGLGMSAPVPTPGACIPPRHCSQKMPSQKGVGERGATWSSGTEGDVLSPWKSLSLAGGCVAEGAGVSMCVLRVCLLNTAPGKREWMEFTPLVPRQTPMTPGGCREFAPPACCHGCAFQRLKQGKKKEKKTKTFYWEGRKIAGGKNAAE